MSTVKALRLQHAQLCRAREMVKHGWTTGKGIDSHGNVCIEGALAIACGVQIIEGVRHNDESRDLVARCYQEIVKLDPEAARYITLYQVYPWNDRQHRKRKVVRVLDMAITTIAQEITDAILAEVPEPEPIKKPVWERALLVIAAATGMPFDRLPEPEPVKEKSLA